MTRSFALDLVYCLDALEADGLIDQKSKNQVLMGQRTRAHPLVLIANARLKTQKGQDLTLDVLNAYIAKKANLPWVRLDPLKVDVASVTALMSFEYAKSWHILGVKSQDDKVVIGTDEPFLTEWCDTLQTSLGRPIVRVYLDPHDIERYRLEFYKVSSAIKNARDDALKAPSSGAGLAFLQLGEIKNIDAKDPHIVQVVDWLLQYAFDQRASDIHLEPREDAGRVRFRIDGILHNVYQLPSPIMTAVVARLKTLARLNIAEKRRPQDGRLKTRTRAGMETELRLSTLPTAFGEKLVMRIFDPEVLLRSFEDLGLSGHHLKKWHALSRAPHGIILVTGPTGSGKTTTLYSTLKTLATEAVNVCTIEDPIEMLEPTFNQMQTNADINLGFADGIKSLLRQDPDIIMVGEIRNQDTATMAVQAALTGHLVFSTLHTNDAPSALMRLHDLGVAPFLTQTVVLGVVAQRLVRTLCPHCKTQSAPTESDIRTLKRLLAPLDVPNVKALFAPKGCPKCRDTGYLGRIGLYEILTLDDVLRSLIAQGADTLTLTQTALKRGLVPLRVDGARRTLEGVTTLAEVMRVVPIS